MLIASVYCVDARYGHTHQKAPDPVRSPKLSWWWRSQYCGGGPHGNTACCIFCIFFAPRLRKWLVDLPFVFLHHAFRAGFCFVDAALGRSNLCKGFYIPLKILHAFSLARVSVVVNNMRVSFQLALWSLCCCSDLWPCFLECLVTYRDERKRQTWPSVTCISCKLWAEPGETCSERKVRLCYHSAPNRNVICNHEEQIQLCVSPKRKTGRYGHTHQKAPDPVRSPKLSWWWRSQYCGGGPHGNTACCIFCIFLETQLQHIKLGILTLFLFVGHALWIV